MVRKLQMLLLALALVGPVGPAFAASEVDSLLNKLVEKGVLSVTEAQEVRNDMAAEAKGLAKAREAEIKAYAQKKLIPSWVMNTKWFGDFRLRFESQLKNYAKDRNRERFRLRFGFKTKPTDNVEVGVRVASGAQEVTSTNQSFTDTFSNKPLDIDKAYLKYSPFDWMSMTGGKMGIPFENTDLVWDGDVTPEGAALNLTTPEGAEWPIKPFVNLGAFRVDELSGDAGDPGLFGIQGGAEMKVPGLGWSWMPAVAYYDWTGIRGQNTAGITNAPSGNTRKAAGSFRDDFDVVDVMSQIKIPEIPVIGKPAKLFADYAYNIAAADDDGAYQFGVSVGKVKKFGDWEASYAYKRLESDAVFGAVTDSDFGGGGTGHKGHKFGAKLGLAKNWYAQVTYFRVEDLEPTSGLERRNNTLQLDTVVKW
ncbi:MAG: hypothetical protein COV76_00320 [Candidatus Omnitrophica bacterium CG11_big_fil_rev_8_21_14_0_20_64_10]|nr:MAG: hypothetical protein COV76_00320 [Candidatus Omnitrophica bacterium CG11_big_fil_rev_8_21_14_0_20_64_10]